MTTSAVDLFRSTVKKIDSLLFAQQQSLLVLIDADEFRPGKGFAPLSYCEEKNDIFTHLRPHCDFAGIPPATDLFLLCTRRLDAWVRDRGQDAESQTLSSEQLAWRWVVVVVWSKVWRHRREAAKNRWLLDPFYLILRNEELRLCVVEMPDRAFDTLVSGRELFFQQHWREARSRLVSSLTRSNPDKDRQAILNFAKLDCRAQAEGVTVAALSSNFRSQIDEDRALRFLRDCNEFGLAKVHGLPRKD